MSETHFEVEKVMREWQTNKILYGEFMDRMHKLIHEQAEIDEAKRR